MRLNPERTALNHMQNQLHLGHTLIKMKYKTNLLRHSLLLITVFLSVSFYGCSSTREIPTDIYSPPAMEDAGVIYFYRDTTMPTKVNLDVKIDDEKMALLPPNRFTWLKISPGKYKVSVGYPSFPDMSAKSEITVEAGKSYLFKYWSTSGGGSVPIFGANGAAIAFIPVGPRAQTLLKSEPAESIPKITEAYKYVKAQIEP
jgi:hypothetical protein